MNTPFQNHDVLVGDATQYDCRGLPPGTAGQALASNGPGADPSYQNSIQNIDALTAKTTPVDADETVIADSAASFIPKKLAWANIKATLKAYFDTLYQPSGVSGGNAAYGNGVDGALSFDGIATPVAGATLIGSVYTMTRDIYASSISIANGVQISNANFRIFCQGAMSIPSGSAAIDCSGGAGGATGTAGAAAAASGTLTGNRAGGVGGTAGGGVPGTQSNSCGGASGAGGNGSGGSGAAGGGTVPTAINGGINALAAIPACLTGTLYTTYGAGSGGGGGGGDGTAGAGGGGGGGFILIAAKTFSGTLAISANGGNGGNASNGTNTGGGGGGGGGVIVITTSVALPGSVTTSVTGGTKGNKKAGGSGTDGVAGSAGNVYIVLN